MRQIFSTTSEFYKICKSNEIRLYFTNYSKQSLQPQQRNALEKANQRQKNAPIELKKVESTYRGSHAKNKPVHLILNASTLRKRDFQSKKMLPKNCTINVITYEIETAKILRKTCLSKTHQNMKKVQKTPCAHEFRKIKKSDIIQQKMIGSGHR